MVFGVGAAASADTSSCIFANISLHLSRALAPALVHALYLRPMPHLPFISRYMILVLFGYVLAFVIQFDVCLE